MAKSITFTDILPPANVSGSVVAGGTLTASYTYFYVVQAVFYDGTSYWGVDGRSQSSAEITVTTDVTNKTARLVWDTVVGAKSYKVYRATTSGSYDRLLAIQIRDIDVNTAGVCTWDDTGYGVAFNNAYQNVIRGKITLSGLEADKFSIVDLYDADVAGGWGVVKKLDDSTFSVNCFLELDGNVYWEDIDKTIIFRDTWTYDRLYGIFGTYDSGKDITYNGCNLISKCSYLHSAQWQELKFYGGLIAYYQDYNARVGTSGLSYNHWSLRGGELIDVLAIHTRSMSGANGMLYKRTTLQGMDVALGSTNATYEDVTVMNCSRTFQTGKNSRIRAVGYVGQDMGLGDCLCLSYGWQVELVDSTVTDTPFKYHSGTAVGAWGRLISSYLIHLVDEANEDIIGASIKVYNSSGTLLLDLTTDANGEVADEIIMSETTFSDTGVKSVAEYGPFDIYISKTGYETYHQKKDITAKVEETVTLKKAIPVMIDSKGKLHIRVNQADVGNNRRLLI